MHDEPSPEYLLFSTESDESKWFVFIILNKTCSKMVPFIKTILSLGLVHSDYLNVEILTVVCFYSSLL